MSITKLPTLNKISSHKGIVVQAQNENYHPVFKILESMNKLQSFVIKICAFRWVYGVLLMVPINQNIEIIHALLSCYWRKALPLSFLYLVSKEKKTHWKQAKLCTLEVAHWVKLLSCKWGHRLDPQNPGKPYMAASSVIPVLLWKHGGKDRPTLKLVSQLACHMLWWTRGSVSHKVDQWDLVTSTGVVHSYT